MSHGTSDMIAHCHRKSVVIFKHWVTFSAVLRRWPKLVLNGEFLQEIYTLA